MEEELRRYILRRELQKKGYSQALINQLVPTVTKTETEQEDNSETNPENPTETVTVAEKSSTDTWGIIMVLCVAAALIILLTD